MGRMSRVFTGVVLLLAAVGGVPQSAAADPIVVPPEGEARLTISVVGADDLVDRAELFLTTAGTNVFGTACAPIDTADGAVMTVECVGLDQRTHFLEATGDVDDEEVLISCGLPGGFAFTGSVVDLRSYPNVLECIVVIATPGIRVFSVDADGVVGAPPATLSVFDFQSGEPIDLTCDEIDVDGDAASFCDLPPPSDFGEYEVVAPDGADVAVSCSSGFGGPSLSTRFDGSFIFVGTPGGFDGFGELFFTCVFRPFGDDGFPSGESNQLFVDIRSNEPGPDLDVMITSDGVDRSESCFIVFDLSWSCSDLPLGVYTVTATGLLPGQEMVVACYGTGTGVPTDTVDLEDVPFGVNCSIQVDTPQIVFEVFDSREPQSFVVLDVNGVDVGDACGPAVFNGSLVVSCQLPLGDYEVPEQEVAGIGMTEFTCSEDKGWFLENTLTLSATPAVDESIVATCFPGPPDRSTGFNVLVENMPEGSELLLNGESAEAGFDCFANGPFDDPDERALTFRYFCNFQGAGAFTLAISNLASWMEPKITCTALDNSDPQPTQLIELTEERPQWECRIIVPQLLPETGSSAMTGTIAALGAALLAAGLALTTAGSRRRRLF